MQQHVLCLPDVPCELSEMKTPEAVPQIRKEIWRPADGYFPQNIYEYNSLHPGNVILTLHPRIRSGHLPGGPGADYQVD